MLALSFNGVEHVEVVERRTPRIKDDMDVIVRVTTTAISSRDLARYTGHDPAPGTIPGAEFCGLVDEVGAGVSAVDLGDLVTGISVFDSENGRQGFGWDGLDGGQALYVRVPFANDTLLKVPTAGIEERALLLGDTYGLGASAAAQATSSGATDICVIGFDPYGASALIALAASGITDVIGLDDEERRLGLAHRLGATTFDTSEERVEDAVREATGGSGFGAVVVGAGLDATQIELGLRLLQPDGVMALTEPDLPGWSIPALANERGIAIRAATPPTRADVSKTMLALWGGTLDLETLVSHVMPLIDGEQGYRQLHARERGANKILLKI
jgi:threonine dehydrogenase-like Zn-dependent dehydrogenase